MQFQQCGPLCPQVCDAHAMCTSGCAEGCFCPDGQVANADGQCVEPGTCPGQFELFFYMHTYIHNLHTGIYLNN